MEDAMKKTHLFLVLVLLLNACGPASTDNQAISTCQPTMEALSALIGNLELPSYFKAENPVKVGGEFDVMQYFSVLDRLSMQPGYVLDYVYHYDPMGGNPVLYVRPANQQPYTNEAALPAGFDKSGYLDHVQVDDTPDGYFQFVALAMMGNQFYKLFHTNYNDVHIVCEKADVTKIVSGLKGGIGYRISIPSWIRAKLLNDVSPSIKINEQTIEVRLVTFTLWGGFYSNTYTLSRSKPHAILDFQKKNLVPYDCGVMF
jgi:hypothetical protein